MSNEGRTVPAPLSRCKRRIGPEPRRKDFEASKGLPVVVGIERVVAMKRLGLAAAVLFGAVAAHASANEGTAADGSGGSGGSFTQALKAEDFSSAGLSKLSPDELAQLDRLVQAFKARAEERAKKAETEAAKSKLALEASESKVQGFVEKTVALLTPGTRIEYKPIDSRIIGSLHGWGPHTVFRLENGQQWRVSNGDSYYEDVAVVNPAAHIRPTTFGFEIAIDGLSHVRVVLVNDPNAQPQGR
jgi:hypothetical protein